MSRSGLMTLLVLATLTAACGGKPAAPTPAPVVTDDSADRARREAEERARREAEERTRREAEETRRRAADEAGQRQQVLAEMVFFDYDKADIRAEFRATLERKAEILRANPGIRLRLEGHADERGSDEYNIALGMRRAAAAKQYLVRLGIEPTRLETRSWGEERPLDTRRTEAGWSRNRRAEFIPLGSMADRD